MMGQSIINGAQLQADPWGCNSSEDRTTPLTWMDAILPPAECKKVSGIVVTSYSIKSCILRASIHYFVHVSDDIQAIRSKRENVSNHFPQRILHFQQCETWL
jgi:hypothetical protein